MSYSDGLSAFHLEMPSRVPRTEYSAHAHWDLIKKVTGVDVCAKSDEITKDVASKAFIKAWNYDLMWTVLTTANVFDGKHTNMGHAE